MFSTLGAVQPLQQVQQAGAREALASHARSKREESGVTHSPSHLQKKEELYGELLCVSVRTKST